MAQTRIFIADLVPEDENSPVDSHAKGRAEFQLDLSNLLLTWTVTYADLTSAPSGVNLCGPGQMGTNGLPFLDLAKAGLKSPIHGSANITEAQIQYMISTWTFVNIATGKYGGGEIRGQLQEQPANASGSRTD